MSGGRYFLSVLATFGVVMAIMVGFAPAAYAEDGEEVYEEVPASEETVTGEESGDESASTSDDVQSEGATLDDIAAELHEIRLDTAECASGWTELLTSDLCDIAATQDRMEDQLTEIKNDLEEFSNKQEIASSSAKDYSDVINKQVAGDFFFIKLADTVLLVLVLGALGWIALSGRD